MSSVVIRNREIGFIFQSFNLIGDLSVYENVELPLIYRSMSSAERKRRVLQALERVEMSHRIRHYPSQLPGGQQQRVAVARALAGSPSILLADEPTGNLDSHNANSVMELLRQLHHDGSTICMVTHDPRFSCHADRGITCLTEGSQISLRMNPFRSIGCFGAPASTAWPSLRDCRDRSGRKASR